MNSELINKQRYDFNDLISIMEILYGPGGCPWDAEQTHQTLKRYLIEEAYEVLDAIESGQDERIFDELGDLLLQIVFHSEIAKGEGRFDIEDVTTAICKKMISRHAHVFGEVVATTPDAVLDSWEVIKKKEKGLKNHTEGIRDIPRGFPALMRAYKVQHKAAKAGFDWDDIKDVFAKIEEETKEVQEAIGSGDINSITDEMGDLLFATVNLSRFVDVQPELALGGTTEKFIRRFAYVEQKASEQGKRLDDMNLAEMDVLWDEAKLLEKGSKVK